MESFSLKRLGISALLAALMVMALSIWSGQSALATDPGEEIPTQAEVDQDDLMPRIECKWELVDWRSDQSGIQYENPSQEGVWDYDWNSVYPSENPACHLGAKPGDYPEQTDGLTNMITAKPNADDDPEEKRIQLWAAVDHPAGIGAITDVYWKVFHPDGTFKVQVHWDDGNTGGVLRQNPSNPDNNNCDTKGNSHLVDNSMWEAAWGTGQVSADAIEDESTGLLALCRQGVKAIYWNEFQVSKEQPCGPYKIEAHAVSVGADVVLTNYIDVKCFFKLDLDFDEIDWGPLIPGIKKVINGNNVFLANDGLPTGINLGNHPMSIFMLYSDLIQNDCTDDLDPVCTEVPGGKKIIDFDACFGRSSTQLTCKDPNGDEDKFFYFGTDASGNPIEKEILCSNMPGKIDFSVHPPTTLPPGTYIGNVQIWGWAVHYSPCLSANLGLDTDQEHTVLPDGTVPSLPVPTGP